MEPAIKEILKDSDLRFTKPRAEILAVFIDKNFALSHADLEKKVSEEIDRVTIYRTLNTFLENGILHKVLDFNGGTKYALCKDECSADHHHHEHVHFKCTKCGLTNCLDTIDVPAIKLPEGFKFLEANFLVQGVCKDCNK